MKQFLLGTLAAILIFAFIHPSVHAQLSSDKLDIQSTQAVAFVKTDRSIIYVKRPGVPVDAFDIAAAAPDYIDSIRNIGVIGMTPQGDRIVFGASLYYINPSNSQHTMYRGLISMPWPPTSNNLHSQLPLFLRYASTNASFRPAGVLSADGKQWWAVTSSASQGVPLIFYHGNTDGSGSIDSATVTADVAGSGAPLQGGFHMSNIAIDRTSNTMFATSFDGILFDQRQSGRVLFYHWVKSPGGGFDQSGLSASNFTGSMKTLNQNIFDNFDSTFGFTVQPANDGFYAYIGMTPSSSNLTDDIDLYKIAFNDANVTVGSANQTTSIPRSAIPSTDYFFAGPDCTSGVVPSYTEDILGGPRAGQCGNSGDVNFSAGGDTAVFVTHEWPFQCGNRTVGSAIWMYDIANQPSSATLVYNDSSAQELQPVFVTALDTIPHTPYITSDAATKNFGSVDTASTTSQTITITDTSSFAGTILDSATITGQNAADFKITAPKFPYVLKYGSNIQLSVTFAPTLTQGGRSATLTLYSTMADDPKVTVSLTGTATVKSGTKGVAEDPALQANIAIDPNPFASQTAVQLTAQDAGTLGIVVHDALGRTVYTSDIRRVNAGATETFTFDAKSIGLSNGVYIVTGLFGDRSASREVVLTR